MTTFSNGHDTNGDVMDALTASSDPLGAVSAGLRACATLAVEGGPAPRMSYAEFTALAAGAWAIAEDHRVRREERAESQFPTTQRLDLRFWRGDLGHFAATYDTLTREYHSWISDLHTERGVERLIAEAKERIAAR